MGADRFIEANGGSFRVCYRPGSRACLVLLHELGGSVDSWNDVVSLLPFDIGVVRLDLRGCGLSEKMRGTASLEQLTDDVAHVLDSLSVPGPVYVAGVAAGGAVALSFAAKYGARTCGVAALAPAAGVPAETMGVRMAMAAEVESSGMRPRVEKSMDNSYPQAFRQPMERFENHRRRWLGNDPGSYAAMVRMASQMDLKPILNAIRCPVILAAGKQDPNRSPEELMRLFAPLATKELHLLNSGHFMHLCTPELVAEMLDHFISGRQPGSS